MLRAGQPAPDFAAPDQEGRVRTLAEFRGRHLVLYFYPVDDTPGCTAEACGFRDSAGELARAGVQVVGVSTQDAASHARFAGKLRLAFPLLADTDKRICKAYGALGLLGVAKRVTFLVGPDGRVERVWEHVRAHGHAREVLEALHARA